MTRRRSYQKGSVELHNGQWTVRYREFNHTTRKWNLKRDPLGRCKDKKAAMKAAEPIMVQVNERNNCQQPQKIHAGITFERFIEKRWRAYALSAEHQPSTTDLYNSLLNKHMLPYFGNKLMGEITPGAVSDFFDSKQARYSGNTLHSLYGLLWLIFEIARQYDVILQSPVRPLIHRPQRERREKPTLTLAQIQTLLALLSNHERLYVTLLLVTGMRMGEGLALRWCDLDSQGCTLEINHTLYKGKLKRVKTEGSKATLRIHPSVVGLLGDHRERSEFHDETDFIFCRADGRAWSYTPIKEHLDKAMGEAGIERVKGQFGFHLFRHTAGTLLYQKFRDLKQVQSVLRHADISTTADIYVHSDEQIIREGATVLAEMILKQDSENGALSVTQTSGLVS